MITIASLQEKIKKCEFKFNDLNHYFREENQLENVLKSKISIVFLNDEVSNKYFEILKSKVLKIIKIKDDFSLICRYFFDYYPNIHSEDILAITKITFSLEYNNLDYFDLNYKKDYDKYIKYLDEAKKSIEKMSSEFFNQIFKYTRNIYIKDDIKCVEESEKKFNEFENIFEENGIDKINKKILILCAESFFGSIGKIFLKEDNELLSTHCLKVFKNPDENGIKKELDLLYKLFKNKNENYNHKKIEDLANTLLILIKKEYLLSISKAIKIFIEKINIKDNDFSKKIANIIKDLMGKNDIEIIKSCKENLKDLNIDVDKDDSDYIDLLISLNEEPELMTFLLKSTPEEFQNIQQLALENNSYYISINDIFKMEKCTTFFKSLNKHELNAKAIIDSLKIKLKEKHYILIAFKNFILKYS